MQELGDRLAVTLSPPEMDVLYDPLESESGTRVSSQNEAYTITEYDLSSLSSRCMDAQFFSALLRFTG